MVRLTDPNTIKEYFTPILLGLKKLFMFFFLVNFWHFCFNAAFDLDPVSFYLNQLLSKWNLESIETISSIIRGLQNSTQV